MRMALLVSNVANEDDLEQQLRTAHLTEPPTNMTKVNADFDGKIRLLGWTVNNANPKRGDEVTVDYYYQCTQTVDEDWQIFLHADGTRGASHRILDDHYAPVAGLLPTNDWAQGDIIRDTFTVKIPSHYPFDSITLWTGFYTSNRRMDATGGNTDGDNRVRTARLTIH